MKRNKINWTVPKGAELTELDKKVLYWQNKGHLVPRRSLIKTPEQIEDLKAATGLSDRELNAAIGWLAREDKIDFDMDQNHDRLFLHVNVYIG